MTSRDVRAAICVLQEDETARKLLGSVLERNGFDVLLPGAMNDVQALDRGRKFVVVADATTACGRYWLDAVTSNLRANDLRVLYLNEPLDGFAGNGPLRLPELLARVAAAVSELRGETTHGKQEPRIVWSAVAFENEATVNLREAGREKLAVTIAALEILELAGISKALGQACEEAIVAELATITRRFYRIELLGRDQHGRLLIVARVGALGARRMLDELSGAIVAHRFVVGNEHLRLTPLVGFVTDASSVGYREFLRRAQLAVIAAASQLDLRAVRYEPEQERTAVARPPSRARVAVQLTFTVLAALVLPFFAYIGLAALHHDVSGIAYLLFNALLLTTAVAIVAEAFLAVRVPNATPTAGYPAATAIIAAYLPNEAATVLETINTFLAIDYPNEITIILAYNTPRPLAIEDELRTLAARHANFMPLNVPDSTSKAQNVNAALRYARGAFVGIFDADHHPNADAFRLAWHWLAGGYDIVQGRCSVRNGEASRVARLVAVEFDGIYGVSHPGRTRLHGFGLFCGSNGYWKTDLIKQMRMRASMLTEDIDASMRALTAGYRIATDARIVSRELAPLTYRSLWHQRARWAQGWFQVTLCHTMSLMRSPNLSFRQKAGLLQLLAWRETYLWTSLQLYPILAFWIFIRHDALNWAVPLYVVTTIFTALAGPLQATVAYHVLGRKERKPASWFVQYVVASTLFFTELKNVIGRIAQLKEYLGERAWRITARSDHS